MTTVSLESAEYVVRIKALWNGCLPKSMKVAEFWGHGDAAYGGSGDDRLLGFNGEILARSSNDAPAIFATIEAAHEAAQAVTNRRAGSLLGVLPAFR